MSGCGGPAGRPGCCSRVGVRGGRRSSSAGSLRLPAAGGARPDAGRRRRRPSAGSVEGAGGPGSARRPPRSWSSACRSGLSFTRAEPAHHRPGAAARPRDHRGPDRGVRRARGGAGARRPARVRWTPTSRRRPAGWSPSSPRQRQRGRRDVRARRPGPAAVRHGAQRAADRPMVAPGADQRPDRAWRAYPLPGSPTGTRNEEGIELSDDGAQDDGTGAEDAVLLFVGGPLDGRVEIRAARHGEPLPTVTHVHLHDGPEGRAPLRPAAPHRAGRRLPPAPVGAPARARGTRPSAD